MTDEQQDLPEIVAPVLASMRRVNELLAPLERQLWAELAQDHLDTVARAYAWRTRPWWRRALACGPSAGAVAAARERQRQALHM